MHSALGNYSCIICDLIETPDRVATRMVFSGTHRGTFFGVPATGRTIEWAGAAFFTMPDGKISTLWVLGDIDSIRRQLGAQGGKTF